MALWEFNACVQAYNAKQKNEVNRITTQSWLTANLVGTAFSKKLKPLKSYLDLDDSVKQESEPVTAEQMAAIDEKAKALRERRASGGTC